MVEPFDFEGFQAGALVRYRGREEMVDAVGIPTKMFTPGTNAFQDAVLMIRDPLIIADPARTFDPCTGAGSPTSIWTFGRIFQDLANTAQTGINPVELAEMWLDHWLSNQTINTFTVPQRLQMQQLINDWRAASGGGQLNLKIAPSRLLTIVPRIDLRDGQGLHAGEARFVFGVVAPDTYASNGTFIGSAGIPGTDTDGNGSFCDALSFSVIFEYRVPACGCDDVQDWAKRWVELASVPFAGTDYFDILEKLTKIFSGPDSDILQPNSSGLSQLRTNEVALAVPWELREFRCCLVSDVGRKSPLAPL